MSKKPKELHPNKKISKTKKSKTILIFLIIKNYLVNKITKRQTKN
jgi:hypothetical protein